MNIFGNKGTISINGSSYSGSNVSIVNYSCLKAGASCFNIGSVNYSKNLSN